MLKKFASIVAAVALVFAMSTTAFAADSKQQPDPNQGKSSTSPATGEESTAPILAVVASVMAGAAVVVGTKKKTA